MTEPRWSPADVQLQEAVTAAHETSTAFSDEVIKEHTVFELSKQQEMKEMLGRYADGQVEMLQRAMDEWDRVSGRARWACSCCRIARLAVGLAQATQAVPHYTGQD